MVYLAPLMHQLFNGSYRGGLMVFIEYHGIVPIIYAVFFVFKNELFKELELLH